MWILFLLLAFAGIAYAAWHIWLVLPFPTLVRTAIATVCVLTVLSIFLSLSRTIDKMPLPLASAVYETGDSALFILIYLVMLFVVLDVACLLHIIPRAWLLHNAYTSLAILILMTAVFGYGNWHYRQKVRQPLQLLTHKPLTSPLTIVMLSDLHLGYHNHRSELHRWVELINREKPDLILIGGDIIDISVRPLLAEGMAEEFRGLKAPVYACLGNHEYYSGEPEAQRFYREAGIHLLQDSTATALGLNIIGRDDRTNIHRKALPLLCRQLDKERYTILLDHQPYHLEQAQRAGIDFQFSGHTHHGQVWPISWITESIYEKAFGYIRKGKTEYYISSGMGIWGGKFRIGTRSEYVVATLRQQ